MTLIDFTLSNARRFYWSMENPLPVKGTNNFTELANSFHPTTKLTAEISDTEITFLDTCVYKGGRFKKHSILDVCTHFKPTETFQYTHFDSCHLPGKTSSKAKA